jgi:hypothetical protein
MKHFFMAAFLFCGTLLAAQSSLDRQVIASQGGSVQTETLRLDWTLGEPAVATLTTPSGYLTEGFQQPSLRVERLQGGLLLPETGTPLIGADRNNYDIRVFPNPVSSQLTVQLQSTAEQELVMRFFDAQGKMLSNGVVSAPSATALDVSRYPDGIYLLSFSTKEGLLVQTYRIVKNR